MAHDDMKTEVIQGLPKFSILSVEVCILLSNSGCHEVWFERRSTDFVNAEEQRKVLWFTRENEPNMMKDSSVCRIRCQHQSGLCCTCAKTVREPATASCSTIATATIVEVDDVKKDVIQGLRNIFMSVAEFRSLVGAEASRSANRRA